MSNRISVVIVKFSFIAAIFVFASCHNDVAELPRPENVKGYNHYCGYKDKNDIERCKSVYEISAEDCKYVGELFCDSSCAKKEPCP